MKESVLRQSRFDEINKHFIKEIDSLKEIMPLIMLFISVNDAKANSDFAKFIEEKGKVEKDDEGENVYSFSPEDGHNLRILERNADIASTALEKVPRSLFVSLISQFDSFIGQIIKEIFTVKPEKLNSSEKNISFSKLSEFNNLDDAQNYIIEKEVESVLRNSHTDHFEWLEKLLNIPLRRELNVWPTFIEITERRNLFVHNNGIVTSQYLLICKKNKVDFEDTPKIGDELSVSNDYFEKAYKALFELSVKLTQVVWRKLLQKDIENADKSLNEVCFNLLKDKHFEMSKILLDFATIIIKKHYNEESKNYFIINKALSFKLEGNNDMCKKIVEEKDWSACSDKFKLAKETLLDNFDEAANLMKKMGKNGEITTLDYKVWPLFNDFRQTKLFLTTYKKVFKEDFTSVETPQKMLEEILERVSNAKKQKKEIEDNQE